MTTIKANGKTLYLDRYSRKGTTTYMVRTRKTPMVGAWRTATLGSVRTSRGGGETYEWRLRNGKVWRGGALTRKEAVVALVAEVNRNKRRAKTRKKNDKCLCREPKTHRDCSYCGWFASGMVCGVCKEAGIDGPVIRGTERRVCRKHRAE